MDWPQPYIPPMMISNLQRYGLGSGGRAQQTGIPLTSQAWTTANLCIFVPFRIPFWYPARQMFWYNFATVSGNVEAAIFNDDISYVKLATTGAVVQAGASQVQYAQLQTPYLMAPGEYRLMLSCSSTTATIGCGQSGNVSSNRFLGLTQFAAGSLPVGAVTPATVGQNRIPGIGITWRNDTPPW